MDGTIADHPQRKHADAKLLRHQSDSIRFHVHQCAPVSVATAALCRHCFRDMGLGRQNATACEQTASNRFVGMVTCREHRPARQVSDRARRHIPCSGAKSGRSAQHPRVHAAAASRPTPVCAIRSSLASVPRNQPVSAPCAALGEPCRRVAAFVRESENDGDHGAVSTATGRPVNKCGSQSEDPSLCSATHPPTCFPTAICLSEHCAFWLVCRVFPAFIRQPWHSCRHRRSRARMRSGSIKASRLTTSANYAEAIKLFAAIAKRSRLPLISLSLICNWDSLLLYRPVRRRYRRFAPSPFARKQPLPRAGRRTVAPTAGPLHEGPQLGDGRAKCSILTRRSGV